MGFRDLRHYLAYLESRGQLLTIQDEIDPVFEIAAYLRKTCDTAGPALLFPNVKGHRMPVVGGVVNSRDRVVEALGFTRENALDRFLDGIRNPLPPVGVSIDEAPCQEIVLVGEEVDLARFPAPTYCAQDGGPYITMAVQVARDPDTGVPNAAIHRMQVKGKNRLGFFWSSANKHIKIQFEKAESRGQALEIAVIQGLEPSLLLASQVRAAYGVDELGIAGGLRGEPVEVVKARTVDLMVPARAEIVFEGRLLPGYRESEGPFGEFSGYYGPGSMSPVMEVTAVTMRRDALWQAGLTGPPVTENHALCGLPFEASLYYDLKQQFPEVRAVHLPLSGCARYTAYVSAGIRYRNQGRCILTSALGSNLKPKMVVLCDEDVDVFDETQVLWAVATRSRPGRDVIIIENNCLAALDPSAQEGINDSMAIDATRPFKEPFPEIARVPGVEKVPDLKALAGTVVGIK
ncbi:MAG: UbiD family decarboxylase [Firmicutes bacterium]|nr:UbiD family decarboxylase [Bacillota bacterium]